MGLGLSMTIVIYKDFVLNLFMIKSFVSLSVCEVSSFVCPPGQTICFSPGGQSYFPHTMEGVTNISQTQGRGKQFYMYGGACIFHKEEDKRLYSIKFFVSESVCPPLFVPRRGGQTLLTALVGGTIFHTQRGGGVKHFKLKFGGNKHFYIKGWVTKCYIGGCFGQEKMDLSEVSIFVLLCTGV